MNRRKILMKKKKKSNLKAKCSATSPDGEGEAKLKNSTGIDSLMDHSEASLSSLEDEADTVCANADERKCQISQRPAQDTESQRQCQTTTRLSV